MVETRAGELLLTWLERRGLAVVSVAWLSEQQVSLVVVSSQPGSVREDLESTKSLVVSVPQRELVGNDGR